MMEKEGTALVIGPGPVTLSQGPAFQYIAARGCGLLRRLGKRVLVLEDNPATLMDAGGSGEDLFVEPPAVEVVQRIVESSGVSSIWHGLGGRRGWSLAMRLEREGWYEASGIRAPGSDDRALWLCGDRSLLRETLEGAGIPNPAFQAVGSLREGQDAADGLGFPLVVRPHFSCGGWGAGLAYNLEDYPPLLEEAMRESLTGEVLVEEALDGWRKYIAIVLRDGGGSTCVPGIFEQQEPLPIHDEDAVLVYPPRRCGREGEYALQEMARQVADALDLQGLVEVKLAAAPGWEALYVIDVNPRPWRTMPLLEAASGKDLLNAHLGLVTGGTLTREHIGMETARPQGSLLAVPMRSFLEEGAGEGYLSLACSSMGRGFFRANDVTTAAYRAASVLRGGKSSSAYGRVIEVLEDLMRLGRISGTSGQHPGPAQRDDGKRAYCLSRIADTNLVDGVLILGADNAGPAGGYEANFNCTQALRAWKRAGKAAAIYTTDPGFAIFASHEADAVFLGPLGIEEIAHAASTLGMSRIAAHFGGRISKEVAPALAAAGLEVWGLRSLQGRGRLSGALQQIRSAGLEVVDFDLSEGTEAAEAVLDRGLYPLLATVEEPDAISVQRMIYNTEDGAAFLAEYGREKILWRPLREEAQEVLVEAVAAEKGHLALLWEQLEAAGIHSADGLAVYPPRYLTSAQSQRALDLARQAIDALAWRGNLSMRMHLSNGDISIWSISPGTTANLPFLYRASLLPLAGMGMMALGGVDLEVPEAVDSCNAVRAPLIPYGLIADSDILPSPQRRSTGSVMGMASDPGTAFAKALWSQGLRPESGGKAFLSVANREKRRVLMLARELQQAGYVLLATRGTAHALAAAGIEVETVNKLREGRPNVLDLIRNGQVGMVVNVPRGKYPHSDGFYIREASVRHGIPCITNMEVALALARGMRQADPPAWDICPLKAYAFPGHELGGG
jgi:carbamoylphosphate synthase large subunit